MAASENQNTVWLEDEDQNFQQEPSEMKRMTSRKSHSWWWDSHISPKNSRWLFENLEQMDRLVKEMLKLIEEEGDTFAKKAEMYYQRRPMLLSHVEDFYRMYRALAERYDNVTGELRKNMPSDLQSQSSGNGSDFGTDPASPSFSPSPDQTPERKKNHPKPFRRAAGFDVFLASAASSDFSRKDSDDSPSSSSSSESGSDSEDGKVVDADDNTTGMKARIIQLEEELREVREKIKEYEKGFNGQCDHLTSMDEHQDEYKMGHETENTTVILEGEIRRLKEAMEVAAKKFDDEISLKASIFEEYKIQIDETFNKLRQEKSILEVKLNASICDLKVEAKQLSEKKSTLEIRIFEQEKMIKELKKSTESSERLLHKNTLLESKVCTLMESENIHAAKFHALENRVMELEAEKCEACDGSAKLIAELNQSLDRYKQKVEMLTLKEDEFNARVSNLMNLENIHKSNLQVLENQVRGLEAEKVELNQSLDVYKMKVNMLTSEMDEVNTIVSNLLNLKNSHETKILVLEDLLREADAAKAEACNESGKAIDELHQSVDRYKLKVDMLTSEKDELSARVSNLLDLKNRHESKIQFLEDRLRELDAAKAEACNESGKVIDELHQSMDSYKLKVDMLTSEKDELSSRVSNLLNLKSSHEAKTQALESRLREVDAAKAETCNKTGKFMDELYQSLDGYKLKVDMLTSEKDELTARINTLIDSNNICETEKQALENRVRELEASKAEACSESAKHKDESLDRYKLKVDMLTSEKDELSARIKQLIDSKNILGAEIQALENRVRDLEASKAEACNESAKHIDELNQSLDGYKLKVDMLTSDKEVLNARVSKLMDDAKYREEISHDMSEHLHQLHIEHVSLIKEIADARKASVGLTNRVKELEGEVEKQRVLLLDGAEGKREAIRQLCFSLEHYRDQYHKLRRMLQGHNRRLSIMTT